MDIDSLAAEVSAYQGAEPRMVIDFGQGKALTFCVPSSLALLRVVSILTRQKEGEMVDWALSAGPDDLLCDVGANAGILTLLAAMRGARVFAFEPQADSYALLCRNIGINNLGEQVSAYCLAASDGAGFDYLHVRSLVPAQSGHSFLTETDEAGEPIQRPYRQGAISDSIDGLIAKGVMPAPSMLKVDVDGRDHIVIEGARGALGNPRLRTVAVELNPATPGHEEVKALLQSFGFAITRLPPPGKCGNVIFARG